MDWSSLFSVENLQSLGVILGTIIAAAYTSYKTVSKKLKEEHKINQTNVSKVIKKQSDLDCSILKEAERVKELLNADRVQVYEFHNGTHYANGRSALRTTCTYETCRCGIKSCLNILSGVPLSVIPTFIKILLDNDELYVKDLEDIKQTMPSTYNFKKSMGIKSFYDVVIHNELGEPIGFVAVQFCGKENHEVDRDIMKKFAWFVEAKLLEMM